MAEYVPLNDFLTLRNKGILLLDARSEKEFEQGHVKGAINLPLLNNEHRHLVGTAYKKQGREAAVQLGFELAGPLFSTFIVKAKELTKEKSVLLYCWRGGMRSGIMGWILSMAGFKVTLLKGGYKTYRKKVLEVVAEEFPFVIVAGKTGSGKTALLQEMRKQGEQVLDLEDLAHHRGSAFGAIGLPPQPTNEQFENFIAEELLSFDKTKIIWAEGESRCIGKNKIPDVLFDKMQKAPMVEVEASLEHRMKRILDEYGKFSTKDLVECTMKLKKRLGDLRMRQSVEALEAGDKQTWLEIMMVYYDKGYSYSISERIPTEKVTVPFNENDPLPEVAGRIIKSEFKTLLK